MSEQEEIDETPQTAEEWLAVDGFADSRAHSSVEIAALMERYAAFRVSTPQATLTTLEQEHTRLRKELEAATSRSEALLHALKVLIINRSCSCYEAGCEGPCPRCVVAYEEAESILTEAEQR